MSQAVNALLLIALISGCAYPEAPAVQPDVDYAPGQNAYSAQGSITQEQFAYLQGLAWPQTYNDITSTFGFPTHRTESADYYRLKETNNWVVVEYSGPQATGYRTE